MLVDYRRLSCERATKYQHLSQVATSEPVESCRVGLSHALSSINSGELVCVLLFLESATQLARSELHVLKVQHGQVKPAGYSLLA